MQPQEKCGSARWRRVGSRSCQMSFDGFPAISAHRGTHCFDQSAAFLALRERRYDCVLISIRIPVHDKATANDLTVEILYDDVQVITAWAHIQSKWARCRKIDVAGVIDEPWVMAAPTAWSRPFTERIFETAGLSHPNP